MFSFDDEKTEDPESLVFTDPDVQKAVKVLLEESYAVQVLCSDTFGYACADSERFYGDDFAMMVPIIAKYGRHALNAYIAVKRNDGIDPIRCKCNHDVPEYFQAKKEIEELYSKSHECQTPDGRMGNYFGFNWKRWNEEHDKCSARLRQRALYESQSKINVVEESNTGIWNRIKRYFSLNKNETKA